MNERFSNELIYELVANIDPAQEILERYGITVGEFKVIAEDPMFKTAYAEAKKFWLSNANARERISQKALAAVEDSLPDLYTIARNQGNNPNARLDAVKQMANLARIDGGERADVTREGGHAGGPSGPSVKISINLTQGANGGELIEHEINDVVLQNPATAIEEIDHVDRS